MDKQTVSVIIAVVLVLLAGVAILDESVEEVDAADGTVVVDGIEYSVYTLPSRQGAEVIGFADESRTDVTIQDSVVFNGTTYVVESINEYAFTSNETIQSLELGNNIVSIGAHAFSNCPNLSGSLILPDSLETIGQFAFMHCQNLNGTLYVPNNVDIGNNAFNQCNFSKIEYAEGTTLIDDSIFLSSNLKEFEIPDTVTTIGNDTFNNTGISGALTIPDGIEHIGDNAFAGCEGITSVYLPESVVSVGTGVFDGCSSLTSMTIQGSFGAISDRMFQDCVSLEEITVPEGITSIGSMAFSGCTAVTSVTIGSSVSSIASDAFEGLIFRDADGSQIEIDAANISGSTFSGTHDNLVLGGYHPTITVEVANGTGGSVTGSGTYPSGSTIVITATADDGYRFVGWSDGNTDSVRNIVVSNTDQTYTAIFEEIPADDAAGSDTASYLVAGILILIVILAVAYWYFKGKKTH